jgi:single-stranded DNA-binding protein
LSIECAFLGVLQRDAESKTSKAGKPYVRFTTRVGEGDGVSWVSVMFFDAVAEPEKFVKGARVYCEGNLKLDKWTAQDGTERHGLNCMARRVRVAAIGANKPKREAVAPARHSQASGSAAAAYEMNDEIPFAPEWR